MYRHPQTFSSPPTRFSGVLHSASICGTILTLIALCSAGAAQKGEWTWISGSNNLPSACANPAIGNCGHRGSYGKLGVASPENTPGGRNAAVTWTGIKGSLWLFGGYGADVEGNTGALSDLWEFVPSARTWTWVSGSYKVNQGPVFGKLGVPAPENTPGSGNGYGWRDADGNLWLANSSGLWEFDPSTRLWTWWGDSVTCSNQNRSAAKCPGERAPAASWVDMEGNLWMFGGYGSDQVGSPGYLNDLWRFDTRSKSWQFMAGDLRFQYLPTPVSQNPDKGSYGNCGQSAQFDSQFTPGSRVGSYAWTDAKGNLWLFGGEGFDCGNFDLDDDPVGYLNDLWEFDIAQRA